MKLGCSVTGPALGRGEPLQVETEFKCQDSKLSNLNMFRHQLMLSVGQKAVERIKGLSVCGNYENVVLVHCFHFQVPPAQLGSRY